jgi:VCBS repeat-containing protein
MKISPMKTSKKEFIKLYLAIIFTMVGSLVSAQEICNNGIDDDGDGLIDLFDSECQSIADTSNFFFNKSIPFCSAKPPVFYTWTLKEKFNTNEANGGVLSGTPPYPIDQRCGLFVGDLDADGVSELVGKDGGTSGAIRVFSGVTGLHIASYSLNTHAFSQVAIADVDDDGNGDIFVVDNSANLVRLEFDKTTKTLALAAGFTQNNAGHQYRSPQVADFDEDGIPEVYVGNRIFNSITGALFVSGSGNTGKNGQEDSWPIAYNIFNQGDLDPDGTGVFGDEADGLELILGNEIYCIKNDAGTWTMTLAAEIPEATITTSDGASVTGDGYTSLGDLNKDKVPDIVVTTVNTGNSQAYIYAYDPITLEQIGTGYKFPNPKKQAGRCNVADFDGDGELEIGTAGNNEYIVLETDLTLKWRKDALDDGSAQTGSTVFDFEGDGSAEVVYSDEDTLFVWKGSDGRTLAKIASPSGTRTDYPLVADVDDDGQAEIVITAQYLEDPGNSPGAGWISVYRSADAPWVPARETWNQHGYFVTNTEDDLIIPTTQQNFVSPTFNDDFNTAFNQFLVQTTYLTFESQPTYATGDLTTENVEFDLIDCPITHEVNFTLTFENNGSWKIPRNTPVSYYDGDPYQPGAVYLDSLHLPENILPGESYTISDKVIDENEDGKMDLYVLVNHSHFTVDGTPLNLPLIEGTINSPTLECDYDNNLGFIVSIDNCVAVSAPEIDLDRNNSSGRTGNDYEIGFAVSEDTKFNVSDADVFIRDTDSPEDLMGAVITLTNLLDVGDETLGITTAGQDYADEYGITVDVTADVVTLSGLGNTLLEYERVIKNITYENSNATPDMTERVITFEVQDGNSINDPLAETHIIYTVHPELDLDKDNSSGATGSDYQATFTEGDAGIPFVDTDLEFTDADGTILKEAVVTLTNKVDGTVEDIKVPFSLPSGILRDFSELTPGKVRLYGTASLADYMTAISSLTYVNTNEDPTAGDRIIEVTINDGYLDSETATATITVVPVNDNPVISGSTEAVIYSTGNVIVLPYPVITDVDNTIMKSAEITISTNFISGEDVLSFTSDYGVTGSFNSTTGILTLTGEATIQQYKALLSTVQISATLVTNADNKAVSVKITDQGDGESNIFHKTVILINDAGNDTPFAADDTYEVFKSNTVIKTAPGVMSNDIDPDGDGITVSPTISTTGSLGGSLTINADGSFTYDPDEANGTISALNYGESVNETFTYTIIDDGSVEPGSVLSNTATITFVVKGENAIPVAVDDSYTVDQDSKLITSSPGILSNDTDADGVTGLEVKQVANSYSSVIYGDYGIFVWYGDGSFVYTPNQSNPNVQALQVGDPDLVETFTYTIEDPNLGSDQGTVTINIQGTNDPPHVYAEKTNDITDINTSLTFNDANNNKIYITDNDADDQQVTITVTDGTFTLSNPSLVSFITGDGTADANMVFTGTLADINSALDGATFNPTAAFTGTAIVVVATDDQQVGTPAETEDDETINILVINPNNAPVVTLPASHTIDEDVDITYSGGTMSIADADGDDQTVTITITNGILTLSGTTGLTGLKGNGTSNITFSGSLTDINNALNGAIFSPTPNYSGTGGVQLFTKDNKGGSDLANDVITINDVDESPVANDDTKTMLEDASATIYAIVNDEDTDGNGISIISNTAVSNGTLTDNGNGTFNYTPDLDFNGTDGFTYTIQDRDASNPDTDDATVTINITPVNDEPSFTKGANQNIDENTTGVQTVNGWATGLSAGPANESSQTLSFNISNDNNALFTTQPAVDASGNLTYELAANQYGTATVTISISDNGGTANGGDDTSEDQTFTITVNPVPQVTLSVDNALIIENGGVATFTASLNHISDQDVTIGLSYSGTATLGGGDAIEAPGLNATNSTTIVIPAGSTTGTVTVTSVDDGLDELNETIVVEVTSVTNGVELSPQSASTAIIDDDTAPTVTFTTASQASAGESGTMTITAQLSALSGQDVTVPFTVNGSSTATLTTDYSITGSPITISAGSTTASITITIATDAFDEADETVIVDMGTPTNATQGAITTHTATITDDDSTPSVTFTIASQASADESGTMTITAQLSAISGQDVTVPFTVNGSSTATLTTDYSINGSPITISAGSTTASITITIATDAIDEADETVIVDMGTPTNATQGAITTHTATITDDDTAPTVTFTTASQASAGESGTMTITAQLSAISGQDVTVPFTVNGSSTATLTTDYSITGSPITISAGSTTASITITIATDAIDEADETVIVDMGTPTNATQGAITTHTATITDDDTAPTVTFTTASQVSAGESGTMTITAQISAISGQDVTVPFTVNGSSTATLTTDYSITGSPITVSAGSTTASITITIATDAIDEADETVIVDMGTPTNATQGAITTHTATITDDDTAPTVTFTTASQASAGESEQ